MANTFTIDGARAEAPALKQNVGLSPRATQTGRKKLVLCLGGGGTRGAAHIGVLRQLENNNIKIDGIVGTSIGAMIGGLYCAGLTPDEIEKTLTSKSLLRAYLTVPITFRLAIAPVLFIPNLLGHHPYDGLYHGNRFAKYINKTAARVQSNRQNPDLNIEDLPIKFEAVCCDLLSAQPVAVCKGNLGRALQASSAIPFLRRPVLMTRADFKRLPGNIKDDQADVYMLVDGGPQANLPILQARALADHLGGAFVVAVDAYGDFNKWPPGHFRKIGSSAERSLEMVLSAVEKRDLDKADLVINPDVSGINLLSTKVSDATRAVAAGDQAGLRAIPQLLKRLQLP